MKLSPALKMALCRMAARRIVNAHRAECPPGFDPQMSSAAIIAGVAAVASTAYTVYSTEQAKSDAEAQRQQAMGQLEGNPLGEVPEPALYEPVDFNASQLAAITGNRDALPFIRELLSQSNNFVTKDALRRADKLIPNYSKSMATLGDSTLDLLGGRLPFDDILDIVSDRAEVGGGLNIPGVSSGATLKDLGISRLDALGKGAGLLGQMVSLAETISPRSTYGKPSDFFMSPTDRIRLEMEQNILKQQSQQNANNLAAAADPNQVAQVQLGLGQALTPPPMGPDYGSAAGQLVTSLGGAWNAGRQAGYWGTPTPNQFGGYGSERAALRADPASFGAAGLDVTGAVQVPGQGWMPAVRPEFYGMV